MIGDSRRGAPVFRWIPIVAMALGGCSSEVEYSFPTFPFAHKYVGSEDAAPVLLQNVAWWEGFSDPILNALAIRALDQNLSLALAKERVIEARAAVGSVPDDFNVNPSLEVERQGGRNHPNLTDKRATLGLDWMLDPYGARREQIKAARARLDAADAEVNAAQLLVLFNLSNAYVDLRFHQRALQLRNQQLQSRQKALDLTRSLLEQNAGTRLDVVRTNALVTETQAQIPPLKAAITRSKHQIAALLGVSPGTLEINLDKSSKQPRPSVTPDVGIPSDLLRNRPDVVIAERLYYATVSDAGVAKAQRYPQLSLGGLIALTSIGSVSGTEYRLGSTVSFPSIFSDDARSEFEAAESRSRQAYTSWKETVLQAVFEVETALVEYSGRHNSLQASQRTAELFRESTELTRDLVLRDGATVLDLVDAEQSVATADIDLAETRRQLALSYIQLNISLGSGAGVGRTLPTEISR